MAFNIYNIPGGGEDPLVVIYLLLVFFSFPLKVSYLVFLLSSRNIIRVNFFLLPNSQFPIPFISLGVGGFE